MKRCCKCFEAKPVTEFYRGRRVCKRCIAYHQRKARRHDRPGEINYYLQRWGRA